MTGDNLTSAHNREPILAHLEEIIRQALDGQALALQQKDDLSYIFFQNIERLSATLHELVTKRDA